MYYPYSENKGADQLRGYREADLRLCFRICKNPGFSCRGSNTNRFSYDEDCRKPAFGVFRPGPTQIRLTEPGLEISDLGRIRIVLSTRSRSTPLILLLQKVGFLMARLIIVLYIYTCK